MGHFIFFKSLTSFVQVYNQRFDIDIKYKWIFLWYHKKIKMVNKFINKKMCTKSEVSKGFFIEKKSKIRIQFKL